MRAEDDILVVDDEIPNLRLLTSLLETEGYRVRPAETGQMAIDSARARPPLLILLDVKMPGIDGFEVCQRLKGDERTRAIPIVFIRVNSPRRSCRFRAVTNPSPALASTTPSPPNKWKIAM